MPPLEDEILLRTAHSIIYLSSDWGPPIPYRAQERPENPDRPNRGFIDLRNNPEAASNIFEARDVPGLQSILRSVNSCHSNLLSLGCERNINYLEQPRSNAVLYLNSYCEITFRESGCQTRDNVEALAFFIAQNIKLRPADFVRLELGLEEMKIFYGERGSYCLNISISAYGVDKSEACELHEYAGKLVSNVLDDYYT